MTIYFRSKFVGTDSIFFKTTIRKTGPTPYCIPHAIKLGIASYRKEFMFNKWCNRPNAAKALYWKLHPSEKF